jgi:hypothetical protein
MASDVFGVRKTVREEKRISPSSWILRLIDSSIHSTMYTTVLLVQWKEHRHDRPSSSRNRSLTNHQTHATKYINVNPYF